MRYLTTGVSAIIIVSVFNTVPCACFCTCFVKVKSDHRSKCSNLSNWKDEA